MLVGHNVKSFDMPILINHLIECNLFSASCRVVHGFIDSLLVSKRVVPKEEVNGCYKQENLVHILLGESYNAHAA